MTNARVLSMGKFCLYTECCTGVARLVSAQRAPLMRRDEPCKSRKLGAKTRDPLQNR